MNERSYLQYRGIRYLIQLDGLAIQETSQCTTCAGPNQVEVTWDIAVGGDSAIFADPVIVQRTHLAL